MRQYLKSPLVVALAIVLAGVLTQSLQLIDHVYLNVWYKNRATAHFSDAVVISIDEAGAKPGHVGSGTPFSEQVALAKTALDFGARRVFLDLPRVTDVTAADEASLQQLESSARGRITFVWRSRVEPEYNRSLPLADRYVPLSEAPVVVSKWNVNYLGFAEFAEAWATDDGEKFASVAASIAPPIWYDTVYADYTINPVLTDIVTATDLIAKRADAKNFAGKLVFITSTKRQSETAIGYFGQRQVAPVFADIAGIYGARLGRSTILGWFPWLACFIVTILLARKVAGWLSRTAIYSGFVVVLAVAPGLLREANVITCVGPAACAAFVYAPLRLMQKWRSRVQRTNDTSGLPNVHAMTENGIPASADVVAVIISQYDQILASLPRELHGECARQISRRLSVGSGPVPVYDNGNGQFVWLDASRPLEVLVEHLEGLRALFSSPLVIEGHVLDTNVHFGIDRNIQSRPMTRVKAALASAQEALGKGKLYEEFGEMRLAESSWELSLHARIDEGLRNGDIWLALQPQYDFRSNRLSGAEALIRWNDPVRGIISPETFILQAERAGRIEAITYWVLEKAIGLLPAFNAIAGPFQISVNLSARIVDHPGLVPRVADIVRETGLSDRSLITFEVTETFSMTNRERARENLAALRAMGFRLSIDDFGTGQASLAYLAEIPCDEVKLDKRFVGAVTRAGRERLIVESVIGLAHGLGQEVVAEGIEDVVTLGVLRELGCDLAQGYHVGKPMRPADLLDLLEDASSATSLRKAG